VTTRFPRENGSFSIGMAQIWGHTMSPNAISADDHSTKDLQRFLAWVTPFAFGFAGVFGVIYLTEGNSWICVLALATLIDACMLLVARIWVRRGTIKRAIALICISLLATDILSAATAPISWPALVILPLLVAAVALPYLAGRTLNWLLGLCWLTGAIVAVLSEIIQPHVARSLWISSVVRVALIMALVSTALLLLWQFSSWLTRTLADMRAANAALRESELRYRSISEITADVIYSLHIDDAGKPMLEWASDSFAAINGGYTLEELLHHDKWLNMIHADDRAIEEQHGLAVMAGHSDVSEYRIITKSGEVRWLRDYARPQWDAAQARVVRILAAATDITERKRAEDALRESRALLQLVADGVPVMIAYVDTEQRYRFVNRGFLEWFGLSELETIGRGMRELLGEQLFTEIARYVDAALAGEQVIFEAARLDHAGMAHDMRVVYIPDKGQDGQILGFVIMMQDITERRRAEEQRLALERKMLETQRLESIGVLAGGIAHDFNNLLTAILGNAGLALLELPPKSNTYATVERIVRAAEQAADLTKQMLAYSGRGHFMIQPLDLNTIIAESRILMDTSIRMGVELRYDLASTLPTVAADAAQIQQVLLNLVLNAVEAMHDRAGAIELHTTVVSADQAGLTQLDLAPAQIAEEYVLLRVSDTGSGMDAETRTRMFDPFFSTKFTGRGLGLAAVLGIVRGHHGGLRVQSEPGRGTIVTVLLPSMRQTPLHDAEPPPSMQPTHSPAVASNTVLVVDDDSAVRAVTTRMLERIGCAVLQAADGQTAIDLFQVNCDMIALVLLDLMMPQLSGEQVLSAFQRVKPGVRVVVMSGYTPQEAAQFFSALTPAGFLQKPFTTDELRSVVRGVIMPGAG
jgi:two-component system, cell cycle sensor histidine kinase and response regulator CckA